MTRPIYEPTTQRQIRKQGFSADQLFRRPAPAQGEANGGGQWCRLGLDNDQTIAAGTREIIEWDHVANPYPTYFEVVEAPPGTTSTTTAINILQNGFYIVSYGLYIDTAPTNFGLWVDLNSVQWTNDSVLQYFGTEDLFSFPVPNFTIGDDYNFKSGDAYLPVYMAVSNAFGANDDIVIFGGGFNLSFMEIERLCDAPLVGNPYDYD